MKCVLYNVILASFLIFFFFNDTATTEIYTLSLHDALPIFDAFTFVFRETEHGLYNVHAYPYDERMSTFIVECPPDRKSTRLNSSHANISYAVFCLKKKKTTISHPQLCVYTRCINILMC